MHFPVNFTEFTDIFLMIHPKRMLSQKIELDPKNCSNYTYIIQLSVHSNYQYIYSFNKNKCQIIRDDDTIIYS